MKSFQILCEGKTFRLLHTCAYLLPFSPNSKLSTSLKRTNINLNNSSKVPPYGYHARKTLNCHAGSNTEMRSSQEEPHEQYAMVGLRQDLMPKHVAFILDGNRRWLKLKGRELDYRPFYEANMCVVDVCIKWGVPTATTFVYGLSTLGRTKEANDLLFRQLQEWLQDSSDIFIRKGVRISVIGERFRVDESLQMTIKEVEEATKSNTTLNFVLAVCYEGRKDLAEATKTICKKVKAGEINPDDVNESMIERHLSARNPNPDLLIRTGSELYLSNFMIWELALTELYFTNIYGPEFNEAEFIRALCSFQSREKAFDK